MTISGWQFSEHISSSFKLVYFIILHKCKAWCLYLHIADAPLPAPSPPHAHLFSDILLLPLLNEVPLSPTNYGHLPFSFFY